MSSDTPDREFAAFVGGRSGPLMRTAYLLTGDAGEADRALVDALAQTRLDWKRLEQRGGPEAYAQRMLATRWKPSPSPEVTDDRPSSQDADQMDVLDQPQDSDQPPDPEAEDRARVWDAYLTLPPAQRTVLVLGVHEQLDDEEIARLTDRPARSTRIEVTRAAAAMRAAVDATGQRAPRPLADRLSAAFDEQAGGVQVEPDLADRALDRAELLHKRHRRRSALVAGAVAVLALVVAGVVVIGGDSRPGSGTSASSRPTSSVAAIPDSVLDLASREGVLLGFGGVVVDGGLSSVSVTVDVDPATGASRGDQIVGLARAEGGYVVLTRPPDGSADGQLLTLSYVPRIGARVELGRVGLATPGFAVSPDGLSVVHVVPGPVDGENALRPGQTELVVQTLAGDPINRLTVDGPASPLSLDADEVWFARPVDPVGAPYVWTRATGDVQRLKVRAGLVALAVRDRMVLMHEDLSDGCFVFVDGHDPSHPERVWRRCTGASTAAISPAGTQVALLSGDPPPDVLVVDSSNGDVLNEAFTGSPQVTGVGWTANGITLIVTGRNPSTGDESAIAITQTPSSRGPATVRHELGVSSVVLGRELPIP